MAHVDWGNVPSWVAAVSTGTSLLVATATYARNSGERKREREEREKREVRRVSAWVDEPTRCVYIENQNDAAILVTCAISRWALREGKEQGVAMVASALCSETLPPHTKRRYVGNILDNGEFSGASLATISRLMVLDTAGLTWVRRTNMDMREADWSGQALIKYPSNLVAWQNEINGGDIDVSDGYTLVPDRSTRLDS